MKSIIKRPLSILLSIIMLLSVVSGLNLTAYAETLDSNSDEWYEDSTINDDVTINGSVRVTDNITLTIPQGKTLTIKQKPKR